MSVRVMSDIERSLREKDRNDCLKSLYSDDSLSHDENNIIVKAGYIPSSRKFSKEEFLAMYYSIVDEIEKGSEPSDIASSVMQVVAEKIYEEEVSKENFDPKTKSGKKGLFRRVE